MGSGCTSVRSLLASAEKRRVRAKSGPSTLARNGGVLEYSPMAENILPFAHVKWRCPECRRGRLSMVRTVDEVNLLCGTCGACWHAEQRRFCRVDPTVCSGCSARGLCAPELTVEVCAPA